MRFLDVQNRNIVFFWRISFTRAGVFNGYYIKLLEVYQVSYWYVIFIKYSELASQIMACVVSDLFYFVFIFSRLLFHSKILGELLVALPPPSNWLLRSAALVFV